MGKLMVWLVSFRLRTLPLSLSGIVLGSLLAFSYESFNGLVAVLSVITAVLLQVLSNVANELGDFIKGVDDNGRKGPIRALQQGSIRVGEMRRMLYGLVVLSLLFGIWLIYEGTKEIASCYLVAFFILGLGAIVSALKYTLGKRPYGYMALGDLFVFVFFGLASVLGVFFLHTNTLDWNIVLPAVSVGLFSIGVLNLNNLRDVENDKVKGKRTLVVVLGQRKAKMYYGFLVVGGIVFAFIYSVLNYTSPISFLFILCLPIFVRSVTVVFNNKNPLKLDKELPKLSIATFIFSILIGVGQLA